METGVSHLLATALRSPGTRLTSLNRPSDTEGEALRHGRNRCGPGHTGHPRLPTRTSQTDMKIKNRRQHKQ